MSGKLTVINRPLTRRVADRRLVVKICEDGLRLRGYRRRKSKFVTREQVASLADESQPLVRHCEIADGLTVLMRIGAVAAMPDREEQAR